MLYYGKLYHKSGDPPMDMLFIYGFDRSYTGLSCARKSDCLPIQTRRTVPGIVLTEQSQKNI